MFYPEEFKKRVKELYPDNEKLISALDKGDYCVGDMLKEYFPYDKDFLFMSTITNAQLLINSATSLDELKTAVSTARNHLFQEWISNFSFGKYSEDFKNRVKAAYPNIAKLHHALDTRNPIVGEILQETYPYDKKFLYVSPIPSFYSLVMSATNLGELQNIVEIAKSHIYQDWKKIVII